MAHSHHLHREQQVAHRRVAHILKDEPSGSKAHSKSHAFSKVTSKSAANGHDEFVAGRKSGSNRYARGGKVKGKKGGHETNIAIVMPHHPAGPPSAGPMAGAAPPPMAAAPAPMPGMKPGLPPPGAGGPPGMPPGGPPMPMRKSGGRVGKARGGSIDGEATPANIKSWSKRASDNSYARGGGTKLTAGAASGVGREEQAARAKRRK